MKVLNLQNLRTCRPLDEKVVESLVLNERFFNRP
jgi:hypothetical protein